MREAQNAEGWSGKNYTRQVRSQQRWTAPYRQRAQHMISGNRWWHILETAPAGNIIKGHDCFNHDVTAARSYTVLLKSRPGCQHNSLHLGRAHRACIPYRLPECLVFKHFLFPCLCELGSAGCRPESPHFWPAPVRTGVGHPLVRHTCSKHVPLLDKLTSRCLSILNHQRVSVRDPNTVLCASPKSTPFPHWRWLQVLQAQLVQVGVAELVTETPTQIL